MPGTTSYSISAAVKAAIFLGAAAEEIRIAALEPHYRLAGTGRLDHSLVDFLLRHPSPAVPPGQGRPMPRRAGRVSAVRR